MVLTIKTISVILLILAALISWRSAVDYWREDAALEVMPSAVERFKSMRAEHGYIDHQQSSPLVQQAQAFALVLNPPRAAKSQAAQPGSQEAASPAPEPSAKPVVSSAKFELQGISYYRSRPAESMALICEPGSGRRWVRQGAQVGHLVIEQINRTSITCRDGERVQEVALAVDQPSVKYAQIRSDKPSPKPAASPALGPATSPEAGKASPPPVRGIRRMPPARVAAKKGVAMLDIALTSEN